MSTATGLALFLLGSLLSTTAAPAQNSPATPPPDNRIYLDVVVTPKSGPPVSGLQQHDFTLLDNKAPRAITSFQAITRADGPVEVILVVDAVNASFQNVAFERTQLSTFLRANGGHLPHPTALAVFTDAGAQLQQGFSTDGNALASDLEKQVTGLRTISRSSGIYGADERFQLSLTTIQQLAAREAARPGRKIILWVSPGWPLLSGPNIDLDTKQRQQIFSEIVGLSTQLRQARITLYSVNPLGAAALGPGTYYYEQFVKGVISPNKVDLGDLALQVLAIQSGGLAVNLSNDVAALLQTCLADTEAYYELSFDPPPAEHPNEYHRLEIQLAKPGLIARTRTGYYAQP